MKPHELLGYAAKDPATWSKDEVRRLLREAATAITKQQQDAERYRWLRKRSPYQSSPGGYVAWAQFSNGRYCGTTHPNHDELDEAIDAAMNGANARIEPGRCE